MQAPDATPDVMHFFQNSQSVNISGNPSFQNSVTHIYRGWENGLERLQSFVSFEAQFDSSAQDPDRRCHPGTRENVLNRLRDWVDNPKSTERIFWLYGPAGAGKSAIAQSIARSYARPKVAASFFFLRSDANRNDGNRLFTTLAYQLAFSMPAIRDHLVQSLSQRPDLPETDIETQFKQLLFRPFQVLSEDATQQLAPAIVVNTIREYQELAPVIVIDGVDECNDENLQRHFLKVIGDAVGDDCFPLRFLIVSRPEVHIEQPIHRFQSPILRIDLAKLDDANRDIEKYLSNEFSRITSEQGIDPAWPGQEIINDIVYKSSGNFIFPSLVIRFVGDPYYFAKAQLDIVLNINPPNMMTPFAVLDQLFLEILKRVPDQDFLKRYLALLVARISVSREYRELYKDDAILMHVSEQEMRAKLRRMRSLLKFEAVIDLHHKSFLDFLHDSSRSGQYHIHKQGGIRGYLEVFIDSLVRYISTMIEQPDHHSAPHFTPGFRAIIKWYPPKFKLPVKEWQEVIQPLLDLQDKLLQLPNFTYAFDFLRCDDCTVFQSLRELMHLGLHLGFQPGTASVESIRNLRNRTIIISSTTSRTENNTNDNDLDSIFLSLFARLPETMENYSPNKGVTSLMSAILRFDYTETVTRVRSVSDAQKLVDLLDYMIHARNVLQPDATRKARLLALRIFARVPIVPLSYFLSRNDKLHHDTWHETIQIEILSQTIFAYKILDDHYIGQVLQVKEGDVSVIPPRTSIDGNGSTMYQWRQKLIPNSVTTIQIMLRLAKAIQYLHSMGVVLYHQFRSRNVILDSDLCPKIICLCSTSRYSLDKDRKGWFSYDDNIFCFGCLFYELYCGVNIWLDYSISSRRRVITMRPSSPEIPEYVWQLIQHCCAEDPKSRPTIDEVVKEMESWQIVEQKESSRPGRLSPSTMPHPVRFRGKWVSIITKMRFPKNR